MSLNQTERRGFNVAQYIFFFLMNSLENYQGCFAEKCFVINRENHGHTLA